MTRSEKSNQERSRDQLRAVDTRAVTFVDVFAGCGGLSLGLMQSGWKGLFAIEADRLAFESLKFNLMRNQPLSYAWPEWLSQDPTEVSGFLRAHKDDLRSLAGQVDLIAGGPPCQGFSLAGRRKKDDPRNRLFKHYLDIVALLNPSLIFFENVRGVSIEFGKKHRPRTRPGPRPTPPSVKIAEKIKKLGYSVFPKLVRATDFGVPQFRPRFIMIAIRADLLKGREGYDPYRLLEDVRTSFLIEHSLPRKKPVTVKQALSDLETVGRQYVPCVDVPGYFQAKYIRPLSTFQKLLHASLNGVAPNSMRLAKHSDEVKERFKQILSTCRRGIQINPEDRRRLKIKKNHTVPLSPNQPSHTLTSLPDDLIHYSEPRILTVREYARLQSFPDWYEFKGKYTTGGAKRIRECPRYTQVANAVPPFMAEVLGRLLKRVATELRSSELVKEVHHDGRQ